MNEPRSHRDTETKGTKQAAMAREKDQINEITSNIIGAAIAVHRALGPGLLESIYEAALCIELDDRKISYVRQQRVPTVYKGRSVGNYVVDLVVDDSVVVEVKSVTTILPVLEAQLMTYMRLLKKRIGLLINFNSALLKNGIVRRVL
jgi:GxxExxY protein